MCISLAASRVYPGSRDHISGIPPRSFACHPILSHPIRIPYQPASPSFSKLSKLLRNSTLQQSSTPTSTPAMYNPNMTTLRKARDIVFNCFAVRHIWPILCDKTHKTHKTHRTTPKRGKTKEKPCRLTGITPQFVLQYTRRGKLQ